MKCDIWIESCRAGDNPNDSGLTQTELLDMVESYDPTFSHEAPVTIDHSQSGPSLGWVDKLRLDNNGNSLYAHINDIDPQLRQEILNGRYKKVSIEYYKSFRGSNKPYFAALSFLGAAAPQVLGLKDATLEFLSRSFINNGNADQRILLSQSPPLDSVIMESLDQNKISFAINSNLNKEIKMDQLNTPEKNLASTNEKASVVLQNTQQESWAEEKEKLTQKIKKDRIDIELDKLMLQGKIQPSFIKSGGREFLFSLSDTIKFSINEKETTPFQWTLDYLANRESSVLMKDDLVPASKPQTLSAKTYPKDVPIDEERQLLHEKAIKILGKSNYSLEEYNEVIYKINTGEVQ